jgi:hypothetical protein
VTGVIVDTVRASRDGHQYHEAWLARRALGLLLPRDGLCGIAIEGLSTDLEEGAEQAIIEVADATFFFGARASFDEASKIAVTQFKYSIARATKEIRFSDIRTTVEKFWQSESSFVKRYGEGPTVQKFSYVITTNRPISPDLIEALAGCAEGVRFA